MSHEVGMVIVKPGISCSVIPRTPPTSNSIEEFWVVEVNRKSALPILEPTLQLQRQMDQFRSTRSRRTKLSEPLWQAAVELARQHGVPVAHPLRLDYMRLKQRLDGLRSHRRNAAKPAIVELVAPRSAALEGCLIEFEVDSADRAARGFGISGRTDACIAGADRAGGGKGRKGRCLKPTPPVR